MDEEFGRYRLERLIGSGGMGDVYQAVDTERDRVVALKLLPPLFSGQTELQERFRRESRLVARLRDPHIIPIHDYGAVGERLYIDMRLVDDGTTVASLLRDGGKLGPERAVHIVEQVAEALDAAHADGLIHRDVKPSNVLVTARDFVYVVDFGIAHAIGQTAVGLTMSGSTVGTLEYMAPERFTNRTVDRRVDVYALTCLLHQCLTGRTPFEGSEIPALMFAHVHTAPPAPSAADPGLPPALDAVVATGMAKDPDDRFATAGALAAAARQALSGDSTVAHLPPEPPRATRPLDVAAPVPPAVEAPPAPPSASPPAAPAEPTPPADGDPSTTTVVEPEDPSPAPTWWTRPGPRAGLLAGAAVVLVVLLVVGLAALIRSDGPGSTDRRSPVPAPAVAAASSPTPSVVGSVPTPATPGALAVAPGGRVAYVLNRDPRLISVIDLATGGTTGSIPIPDAPPRFAAFSADGSRAYVSAYTDDDAVNVVHVVDTRAGAVVATVPVDRRPYALAVSPDRSTVWVPSHDDATIDLLDTATNTVSGRIRVAPNPHWVAFGAGRAYVANHESNLITVLDPSNGATVATVPVGASPHALAVSPDDRRVTVVNYDGASISVIDTGTNGVVATIPVGRGPQYVAYAPDGRHLYTANVRDGTVSVVDTATSAVTATLPVCSSPTSVVPVVPDGTTARVTCLDEARLAVLGLS